MKKQLLFVAAMFAAVCANAQGTWNCVGENDALDAVVVAASETPTVMTTPIQNATIALMDGANAWTVKNTLADQPETFTGSNGVEYSKCYIQGGTNGMVGHLQHSLGVSAHIEFTPDVAGTVWIAAKYGANKPIWAAKVPAQVIEDEELDYAGLEDYQFTNWGGYIKDDGTVDNTATGQVASADTYAALPYEVEPGNTYFFWVSGSKIMLCGITFEVSSTGISNITTDTESANAPVYNLAGQRVSKDAKGILIQNGKKFINK